MNEFNQRWQRGAQRAQQAAPEAPGEAPFGFTARVLAGARANAGGEISLERVWERFGWRTLAGATLVLLLEGIGTEDRSPLQPEVESVVAEAFWLL